MRKGLFVAGALVVIIGLVVIKGVISSKRSMPVASPTQETMASARTTPVDSRIRKAETIIEISPDNPDGYNLLASGYMQKARETGDFSFNKRAESALKKAFELSPENLDALNLRAALLVTNHQFGDALEVARRAQQIRPANPDSYAVMTDALAELGDYAGAIEAAQRMMDLRPDSVAYSRASHLRALHGDVEGAVEAMSVAVKAAGPADPEHLSWYRVHLGIALMNVGKLEEAEHEFDAALQAFPDYHIALAAKGRARMEAGDYEAAISFYRKAQERVPLPGTAIALGDLYTRQGRLNEAKRQEDFVEVIERAGAPGSVSYSRQLALFWADHDTRLDEAVAIMRRERAARSDIYTCDALAWCLFKKGELREAAAAISEAMKLGTRDARIFYHAGSIHKALGDRANARRYLKLALETRVSFDNSVASFTILQAETAKRALEGID